MVARLRLVADHPEVMDDMSVPELAALIATASAKVMEKSATPEPDRLIEPEEAAPIVGIAAATIRKRKAALPFVRQPSGPGGRVKCSLAACRLYVARMKRVT